MSVPSLPSLPTNLDAVQKHRLFSKVFTKNFAENTDNLELIISTCQLTGSANEDALYDCVDTRNTLGLINRLMSMDVGDRLMSYFYEFGINSEDIRSRSHDLGPPSLYTVLQAGRMFVQKYPQEAMARAQADIDSNLNDQALARRAAASGYGALMKEFEATGQLSNKSIAKFEEMKFKSAPGMTMGSKRIVSVNEVNGDIEYHNLIVTPEQLSNELNCKDLFSYAKQLGIANARKLGKRKLVMEVLGNFSSRMYIEASPQQIKEKQYDEKVQACFAPIGGVFWTKTSRTDVAIVIELIKLKYNQKKKVLERKYKEAQCEDKNMVTPVFGLGMVDCKPGYIKAPRDACCKRISEVLGTEDWENITKALEKSYKATSNGLKTIDEDEKFQHSFDAEIQELIDNTPADELDAQVHLMTTIKSNIVNRFTMIFTSEMDKATLHTGKTPCELEEEMDHYSQEGWFWKKAMDAKVVFRESTEKMGSFVAALFLYLWNQIKKFSVKTMQTLKLVGDKVVKGAFTILEKAKAVALFIAANPATARIILNIVSKFKMVLCKEFGQLFLKNGNGGFIGMLQNSLIGLRKIVSPGEVVRDRKRARKRQELIDDTRLDMQKTDEEKKKDEDSMSYSFFSGPLGIAADMFGDVKDTLGAHVDQANEFGILERTRDSIMSKGVAMGGKFIQEKGGDMLKGAPIIGWIAGPLFEFATGEITEAVGMSIEAEAYSRDVLTSFGYILDIIDLESCLAVMPRHVRDQLLGPIRYIKNMFGIPTNAKQFQLELEGDMSASDYFIPDAVKQSYTKQEQSVLNLTSTDFQTLPFDSNMMLMLVNSNTAIGHITPKGLRINSFTDYTNFRRKQFNDAIAAGNVAANKETGNTDYLNIDSENADLLEKQVRGIDIITSHANTVMKNQVQVLNQLVKHADLKSSKKGDNAWLQRNIEKGSKNLYGLGRYDLIVEDA